MTYILYHSEVYTNTFVSWCVDATHCIQRIVLPYEWCKEYRIKNIAFNQIFTKRLLFDIKDNFAFQTHVCLGKKRTSYALRLIVFLTFVSFFRFSCASLDGLSLIQMNVNNNEKKKLLWYFRFLSFNIAYSTILIEMNHIMIVTMLSVWCSLWIQMYYYNFITIKLYGLNIGTNFNLQHISWNRLYYVA